jgi:hypothetical protein
VPAPLERGLAAALVVVHAGLLAWGLIGFAELTLPTVPWRRISNPLFSTPMLALQWSLAVLAGATYLAGFFLRWSPTPMVMTAIFTTMAVVCAYQNFFILTNPARFRAMALEYAAYALILVFLFSSKLMRARFT